MSKDLFAIVLSCAVRGIVMFYQTHNPTTEIKEAIHIILTFSLQYTKIAVSGSCCGPESQANKEALRLDKFGKIIKFCGEYNSIFIVVTIIIYLTMKYPTLFI